VGLHKEDVLPAQSSLNVPSGGYGGAPSRTAYPARMGHINMSSLPEINMPNQYYPHRK
jgi:hypothetical protein